MAGNRGRQGAEEKRVHLPAASLLSSCHAADPAGWRWRFEMELSGGYIPAVGHGPTDPGRHHVPGQDRLHLRRAGPGRRTTLDRSTW